MAATIRVMSASGEGVEILTKDGGTKVRVGGARKHKSAGDKPVKDTGRGARTAPRPKGSTSEPAPSDEDHIFHDDHIFGLVAPPGGKLLPYKKLSDAVEGLPSLTKEVLPASLKHDASRILYVFRIEQVEPLTLAALDPFKSLTDKGIEVAIVLGAKPNE